MNPNLPSNGEPEPIPGEVVSRETTETYTIEAWAVSAEAAGQTRVVTYDRTDGYVLLNPNDNDALVEDIDDVLAEMYERYGAVDEDVPTRTPGDAYEIVVTISDPDGDVPYDSRFDFSRTTVHVSPDFDDDLVDTLDEVFDELRTQVSDD